MKQPRGTEMNPIHRRAAALTISALALLPLAPVLHAQQTRAERTKYTETSLYGDVISFLDSLQQRGAKIHVGFIGRTMQGRDVPYVIASRPLVTTPLEAKRLGPPVVDAQGDLHPGERAGDQPEPRLRPRRDTGDERVARDVQRVGPGRVRRPAHDRRQLSWLRVDL